MAFQSEWCGHDWHEMHHLDHDGKHFCPTGFDYCHLCGASQKRADNLDKCWYWDEYRPAIVASFREKWTVVVVENISFASVTKLL